ncbi:Uncharacterised protein [Mycobacteroides abscessus subsp. abscessus]|nr:Uncharacterised protein [Mycobacteroides abscessus subsp. abscessus]
MTSTIRSSSPFSASFMVDVNSRSSLPVNLPDTRNPTTPSGASGSTSIMVSPRPEF